MNNAEQAANVQISSQNKQLMAQPGDPDCSCNERGCYNNCPSKSRKVNCVKGRALCTHVLNEHCRDREQEKHQGYCCNCVFLHARQYARSRRKKCDDNLNDEDLDGEEKDSFRRKRAVNDGDEDEDDIDSMFQKDAKGNY